jgi:hypothetical protein
MQPPFLQSRVHRKVKGPTTPSSSWEAAPGCHPPTPRCAPSSSKKRARERSTRSKGPNPGPGEAIVAVRHTGVCGTDIEFFRGTQLNLAMGTATFPLRLGHEWSGVVDRVGPDVDPSWIGARVTAAFRVRCGDAIYVAPPAYGK